MALPRFIIGQVREKLTQAVIAEIGATHRCAKQFRQHRLMLDAPVFNSYLAVVGF